MSSRRTTPVATSDAAREIALDQLVARIAGAVIAPWDAGYDEARRAWNLAVDQYPAIIVEAGNTADVQAAVRFARAADLSVAVQSTGHGIARKADGALLLVTSRMTDVRVDAAAQTAWAEAGARWQAVLDQAQAVGLAPLLGSSPDVGVMGYTLGGGMGWLARRYGLAADSVVRFEVVTADGRALTASPTENSDLFWGLRGGGSGLAVATGMEIRLYPVAQVFGGSLIYPAAMAKEVFLRYRAWVADAPDELTSSITLMNFPPLPDAPEFLRGQSVVMVRGCFCGPADEGQALLQFWLKWRAPIANLWQVMPFGQVGSISQDPPDPLAHFQTGAWLRELGDGAMDILIARTFAQQGQAASPLMFSEVRHAGGAISRVGENDSPIGHRASPFVLSMIGVSPTSESHERGLAYVARVKTELQPWVSEGAFLNFLSGDELRAHTQDGYSPASFQRLAALKTGVDPQDMFSHGFDLRPSVRPALRAIATDADH